MYTQQRAERAFSEGTVTLYLISVTTHTVHKPVGTSGGKKASGWNPAPLYLQLAAVGQLGLELSVGQLGGPQVALETLHFFQQPFDLQVGVGLLNSQR